MKKEYDFSRGERGKFYRPGARLCLPVYLNQEALAFVQTVARRKGKDMSALVNEMILSEKRVVEQK
jgi:hypothetical protein